ncbi:MAG: glycine--tRNA ligase subunit beta [Candidatus Caldarchaeum sp.]
MEKELVVEVGTEEIPSAFLGQAVSDLRDIVAHELKEKSLPFATLNSYGTPRRLVLHVTGLPDVQPDRTLEILGPPTRIALNSGGTYTKAALGFAKAQGVRADELVIIRTERGDFVGIRKEVKGEKTLDILKELLPRVILSIPFRKSMRWGTTDIQFVRPIRWVVAVFDGETVPFKIGDVVSSNISRGHRFLSPEPFKIASWNDYVSALSQRFVVFDPEKRKRLIIEDVEKIANELGGYVERDDELLDTVTNLVEYPVVMRGSFSEEFLSLPKEVLISVMRNQQRYFHVYLKSDVKRLLPHFIFVAATRAKDPHVVASGYERVIRARFSDAKFFFEEDKKTPLYNKIHALSDMTYLSGLGSYYEKTQRLVSIASNIAILHGLSQSELELLRRAAELSKADLATQMVFEFPELQGIMGKYYAIASGEEEEIAIALEEQYMPRTREDRLPQTQVGAMLSIADKVDNICSCFLLGLTPTGDRDPYALRRQAIAIINILIDRGYHIGISTLFQAGISEVVQQREGDTKLKAPQEALREIKEFLVERFKYLLIGEGFSADVVEAVIEAGCEDIPETKRKIAALEEFARATDFKALAIAFKRVVNIVRGQPRGPVQKSLFTEEAEHNLYQKFLELREDVRLSSQAGDYALALQVMRNFKEPVDEFFEKVLVMEKNEQLRLNRLSLLWEIRDLFFTIADFSKIST